MLNWFQKRRSIDDERRRMEEDSLTLERRKKDFEAYVTRRNSELCEKEEQYRGLVMRADLIVAALKDAGYYTEMFTFESVGPGVSSKPIKRFRILRRKGKTPRINIFLGEWYWDGYAWKKAEDARS